MPKKIIPIAKSQLAAALETLGRDERLGGLIAKLPAPRGGGRREPFDALVVAIVSQLISRAAAGSIAGRLGLEFGRPFDPAQLAQADIDTLRQAGLSRTKAECIRSSAQMAIETGYGRRYCSRLADAEIVELVTGIKGAGQWTAHMVLIFGLGRPDVMPLGDGGILRAAAGLFNTRTVATTRRRLARQSENWRPYRSVAAWYLWKSLDN